MADEAKLAFHRRYRPNTLKKYTGNEKLKATALAALARPTKPQVILMQGASGCGKTTFARLLAKEYSCENRNPDTGACGCCPSCLAIDDYIQTGDTSMLQNIKEVDIADQSGKKDIDIVLEDMEIPSFGGQWKVYILDECHVATVQAQNRMLKICEEPPENVLIIFCTTDPEKMLHTLVNRCQLQLHVKKPTVADLSGLLKYVCTTEQVDYNMKGLSFIANRSELTIRQALTNLEQVINEKGKATYDCAVEVFEEVSDKVVANFFRKLLPNANGKRDVTGYISLIAEVKAQTSLRQFVDSVIDFTKKGIYIINQVQLEGVSDGELAIYRDIFMQFSVEQMASLLMKLEDLKTDGIEMKLFLLGYTGILNNPSAEKVSANPTMLDSLIVASDDELSDERKQADKNTMEKEKQAALEGIGFADTLNESASLDDIQSMFGGATII